MIKSQVENFFLSRRFQKIADYQAADLTQISFTYQSPSSNSFTLFEPLDANSTYVIYYKFNTDGSVRIYGNNLNIKKLIASFTSGENEFVLVFAKSYYALANVLPNSSIFYVIYYPYYSFANISLEFDNATQFMSEELEVLELETPTLQITDIIKQTILVLALTQLTESPPDPTTLQNRLLNLLNIFQYLGVR